MKTLPNTSLVYNSLNLYKFVKWRNYKK